MGSCAWRLKAVDVEMNGPEEIASVVTGAVASTATLETFTASRFPTSSWLWKAMTWRPSPSVKEETKFRKAAPSMLNRVKATPESASVAVKPMFVVDEIKTWPEPLTKGGVEKAIRVTGGVVSTNTLVLFTTSVFPTLSHPNHRRRCSPSPVIVQDRT